MHNKPKGISFRLICVIWVIIGIQGFGKGSEKEWQILYLLKQTEHQRWHPKM